MKPLKIRKKRELSEETRLGEVYLDGEVYSIHLTDDEVILTDTDDYTKIYSIQAKELYFAAEKEAMSEEIFGSREG